MPPLVTQNPQNRQVRRLDDPLESTRSKLASFFIRRRKRVRFAPSETYHEVPSCKDMTPNELCSYWFNKEDLDDILRVIKYTIYLITENPQMLERRKDKFCARGLEHMVNETEIFERMQRAREAVSSTQEFLEYKGENPRNFASVIAEEYRICTVESASEALDRALRDYEDVQREN